MKKKYTKSQRKHIRKEKARIRGEFSNSKKQEEAMKKLFDKVSGKLHIHPAPKAALKPKQAKEGKKTSVAKKQAKGTIKEEKVGVSEDKKDENK